jgi:hypothetical protein
MAAFADRVQETTTTTGTGSVTLAGAVIGFCSFATAFASTVTVVYYAIVGQAPGEWEVGIGTFDGATTLDRTTPLAGSAGLPVNLSTGTKDVFVTIPAAALNDRVFNVKEFGAKCDSTTSGGGTDDRLAIVAALAALPYAGGTLFFPAVCRVSAPIEIGGRNNIRFTGAGSPRTQDADFSGIVYSGTTGSLFTSTDPVTHAPTPVVGVEIDHMGLWFSDSSYAAGPLLNFSTASGRIHIHDAFIGGSDSSLTGGVPTAATLIQLTDFYNLTIENSTLQNAGVGIAGPAGSPGVCSGITIRRNSFTNWGTAGIVAVGSSWVIDNNEFEPGATTVARDITTNTQNCEGIRITSNWFGDAATGTYINAPASNARYIGALISGNLFHGATTQINLGGSWGVSITGNSFTPAATVGVCVNLASAIGVTIIGNRFDAANMTSAIIGASASNVRVANNELDAGALYSGAVPGGTSQIDELSSMVSGTQYIMGNVGIGDQPGTYSGVDKSLTIFKGSNGATRTRLSLGNYNSASALGPGSFVDATTNYGVSQASGLVLGCTDNIGPTQHDVMTLYHNGAVATVSLADLPVYADNTAAASLATNSLYKTSTGVLMIKY